MSISKLKKVPVLRKPDLIAAWPGVQNVSLSAVEFLKDKLRAKTLMKADLQEYYSPSGVSIHKGLVINPSYPSNNFYYWINPTGDKDLVIFISDAQPNTDSYDLAHEILDIAQGFGIGCIYTAAAYFRDEMHYSDKPRIFGAATHAESAKLLGQSGISLMEKGQVAGMNGLILGAAKERKIPAICLLTEVPRVIVSSINPKAACTILEGFKKLLGIKLNLKQLETFASQIEEEISKASKEAMGKYIQNYTVDYRDLLEGEN